LALPQIAFWFLRHGETDYNAAGLSQGALDITLNANGRAQAATAALELAGRGITRIISSPLRRARETAEIVNATLRLPLIFEPELREVIFGGMEGRPLHPWFNDWLEERATPEGAESFAAVRQRVATALARVLSEAPAPVLIVAHGGVFRAVRDLMQLPKQGLSGNAVPLFCQPSEQGWQVA
jgi:probable phosphoglycerate mutase